MRYIRYFRYIRRGANARLQLQLLRWFLPQCVTSDYSTSLNPLTWLTRLAVVTWDPVSSLPQAGLECCLALHALLRVLWSGRWKACAPTSLVEAIWAHAG